MKIIFDILYIGGSMDSKIQTLIEKLNLSKECIDCLEGAKLNRIVANKEKTNYCFYIDIKDTLEISLYEEFTEKDLKRLVYYFTFD